MAAHIRDDILHGRDHEDTHLSQNRWRHQESASFARHTSAAPRKADERHGSKDLADFFNSSRVQTPPSPSSLTAEKYKPITITGNLDGAESRHQNDVSKGNAVPHEKNVLEVRCGPLLNYRRMENETWFGSVLIVTRGGGLHERPVPQLILKVGGISASGAEPTQHVPAETNANTHGTNGHVGGPDGALNGGNHESFQDSTTKSQLQNKGIVANSTTDTASSSGGIKVPGTKLYSDSSNTFWRFDLRVPMRQLQTKCEYSIPGLVFARGKKTDKQSFFVPAISESMRIMFHSCNGFSVGTDEDAWSGAALWNDVLRVHQNTPFHVMLGGGDQIYNDGIRVNGPLRPWTDIGNPKKRRDFPFPEELRRKCDEYYVNNYIRWYGTEPFASANGKIPQVNLWDDHDIIDGFGSYVDDFMQCAVFRGIGGVAHKYYLLFQHHLAPPLSTFTTDARQTTSADGPSPDSRQLDNTYVLEEKIADSSYIIGPKPGPYVAEHSRSIYARLGARIAFFGIDARTERTRKQVNYPETYDAIFARLRKELGAAGASSSPIQHLIVVLGIPIAYPRLTWLENIFSSPIMGPMKFLNKRFGFGGGFFNHFDGSVDLLDDLDDHYTARTHKKERLYIVHQLQALASEFSVRVSILGGDVHLAAVGRFYSNPKLQIPISNDYRYMPNIISSAIVNKPPPQAVANLLARRNKLHHLDQNTDETLMNFFDKDPGDSNKTGSWNKVTMPSRNWAMITENYPTAEASANGTNGNATNGHASNGSAIESIPQAKDGHSWLHTGEVDAGTKHKAAASETHGKHSDGSLDVCIRVEINQHDKEGRHRAMG